MPYLKRLIPIALVVLVVWGAVWWWWLPSNQSVDVTLEVAANAPALGMRDITVVVGGEKTGWAEIKRGQTVSASFHPAPDAAPELTLIYQLMAVSDTPSNNEQQSWRGPAILPGQGYNILILLNAQGNIVSQHCVKPCTLGALN